MIVWDLVYSLSEPNLWISFSVIYHVTSDIRNVDITGLSKGHISLLLEARVTWSGVLVVLYVSCLLIWHWPNAGSRSRSRGYDRQPPFGAFIRWRSGCGWLSGLCLHQEEHFWQINKEYIFHGAVVVMATSHEYHAVGCSWKTFQSWAVVWQWKMSIWHPPPWTYCSCSVQQMKETWDLVVIRNSVRLICLSVCHTRALWLIQITYWRYFYTIWKGNPSSFLPPNSGWWATSPST